MPSSLKKSPFAEIKLTVGTHNPVSETVQLSEGMDLQTMRELFPKFFYIGEDPSKRFTMLEDEKYLVHRGQLIVSGNQRYSNRTVEFKVQPYIVMRKKEKKGWGDWDIFCISIRPLPRSVAQARHMIDVLLDKVKHYYYGVHLR